VADEPDLLPPGASQGPVQAVSAMGFPSPARDYFDGGLDLNRLLVRDRVSTFIMRVSGHAMQSAGIFDGDEVIVDRALSVRDGSVVIVNLNGQMLVRRWHIDGSNVGLLSDESPLPVWLTEGDEVGVFGIITRCLHHVR